MSDDRLFASNQAIGRKWYYINIVLLVIIAYITNYVIKQIIYPSVTTDFYIAFTKGVLYFAYFIFIITFFALIERRLYDLSGSRSSKTYKNIFQILEIIVIYQAAILILPYINIEIPIDINQLQQIANIFDIIFLVITFLIGFKRGKISCLTKEEYKNKLKYDD